MIATDGRAARSAQGYERCGSKLSTQLFKGPQGSHARRLAGIVRVFELNYNRVHPGFYFSLMVTGRHRVGDPIKFFYTMSPYFRKMAPEEKVIGCQGVFTTTHRR
jgi:hypothetical protein